MFVSIIIPFYKDWTSLKQCLAALNCQTYPKENFEVIIVNNDPDTPIPDHFVLYDNTILLSEAKAGSYAARNTGIRSAKGEIIGFTDADCIPDKYWIENAVAYLLKEPACTRIAGPVHIIQKGKKPTVIERYNQLYAFPQMWLINNGGGSVTANLFVRNWVFAKVGMFDEKLLSMGDKQWGMRVESAGYKIAYVEDVVVHHPPRNLKELIRKEKRHAGALVNGQSCSAVRLYLDLIYDLRPKLSGLKFMLSKSKNRSLSERLIIPLLRHFLLFIRKYETTQISLGKRQASRV